MKKAKITTQKRRQSSSQIFGGFLGLFFFLQDARISGGQVLTAELLLHVLLTPF